MARSPNRIPEILSRIQRIWEQQPDLRFGQLLINFMSGKGWLKECEVTVESSAEDKYLYLAHTGTLFYLEDKALMDLFEEWYASLSTPRNPGNSSRGES